MKTSEHTPEGYGLRLPFRASIVMGVILMLATAIRVWSAQGDMWIDEIWSLNNLLSQIRRRR